MPEETPSAPAGVAAEISAPEPLTAQAAATFGRWLQEKLGDDSEAQNRVALHSGLPISEFLRLLDGQGGSPLDRDRVQRIASALVEMQTIPDADEAWNAAGLGSSEESEYVVSPTQVVQAMSGNI